MTTYINGTKNRLCACVAFFLSKELILKSDDRVLVLGSTGFIGSRLIPELSQRNIKLRLFVRNPSKASALIQKNADIEVVCLDRSIDQFVPIVKTPFKEAVKIAVSEEKEGPGIAGF
jgi:5,10-methylene-tetrahydrofolate dehydrogenase/methenyl tetrahydrofolate cyclohydrolase